MKLNKILILSSMLVSIMGLTSCGSQKEQFILPDIANLSKEEAGVLFADKVNINYVDYPNYKYIEGRIYDYENLHPGDSVDVGSTVNVLYSVKSSHSAVPEDSFVSYIDYTTEIYQLTGRGSVNEEMSLEHGISGCDLGIPFTLPDGRIMMLYGDTFSAPQRAGYWMSNYMAITSDHDLTDGLQFDEIVSYPNGMAKPFAQGAHQNDDEFNKDVEVTKIPTGAITVNGEVYIFYMSVRYWGPFATWNVNYNQCVKATDDTYETWENVESLKWLEDENYYLGQIYPIEEPNHPGFTYFVATAGGRHHGAVMMRVDNNHFEERSEYEYLVSEDEWVKGDEGMNRLNANPYFVFNGSSIEPQVFFSSYLNKYIMLNSGPRDAFGFYYSDNIEGPYENYYILPVVHDGNDASGCGYGPFLHSYFSDYNGQRLFMQISRWETYVTYVVEIVLK